MFQPPPFRRRHHMAVNADDRFLQKATYTRSATWRPWILTATELSGPLGNLIYRFIYVMRRAGIPNFMVGPDNVNFLYAARRLVKWAETYDPEMVNQSSN